jgi:hypothetical protein
LKKKLDRRLVEKIEPTPFGLATKAISSLLHSHLIA